MKPWMKRNKRQTFLSEVWQSKKKSTKTTGAHRPFWSRHHSFVTVDLTAYWWQENSENGDKYKDAVSLMKIKGEKCVIVPKKNKKKIKIK